MKRPEASASAFGLTPADTWVLGSSKAELEAVLQLTEDRKLWAPPAELLEQRPQRVSLCLLEIPARLSINPCSADLCSGTVGTQGGREGLVQGTTSSAQSPQKTLAALQQHLKTPQDL